MRNKCYPFCLRLSSFTCWYYEAQVFPFLLSLRLSGGESRTHTQSGWAEPSSARAPSTVWSARMTRPHWSSGGSPWRTPASTCVRRAVGSGHARQSASTLRLVGAPLCDNYGSPVTNSKLVNIEDHTTLSGFAKFQFTLFWWSLNHLGSVPNRDNSFTSKYWM